MKKLLTLFVFVAVSLHAAPSNVYFKNVGGPDAYIWYNDGSNHLVGFAATGDTVTFSFSGSTIGYLSATPDEDEGQISEYGWGTSAWSGSRYPAFTDLDGDSVGVYWDSTGTWWTWEEPWAGDVPVPPTVVEWTLAGFGCAWAILVPLLLWFYVLRVYRRVGDTAPDL